VANRKAAIESIIEAGPVATCVRALMIDRIMWTGSASELSRLCAEHARADILSSIPWAKNPRALAGRLRRAQTFLRTLGIEITFRTGAAAEVVRLIRRRELTMVATVALFVEYEAVLTRPEHLARAEITAAEAEIALDVLAAVVEPVESHFLWRPRLRDADDDMVLEAAANGRAAMQSRPSTPAISLASRASLGSQSSLPQKS
jgi:hypothetical protein